MNTHVRPDIFLVDDLSPENVAMLQALYSRDPRSVVVHLEAVKKSGAEKFMANYYVGYGHKSIGDCGTASLFIENVSMLCAKAIQQWPLYNGQEASTRYLDMSAQPILNPLGTPEGEAVLAGWMALYIKTLDALVPWLKEKFPMKEGDNPKIWEKAIKAKAFDIARSLLPAGCTTFVSWHTNLRQAADHVKELRHHPLKEVRDVAAQLTDSLKSKYAASFSHKTYPDDETYVANVRKAITYTDADTTAFSAESRLNLDELAPYQELLSSRPPKSELPQELRMFGDIRFKFPLDFGSYRDLQRQRSMVHVMPLLTTRHGFHPWYLESFPPDKRAEIEAEITRLQKAAEALPCSPEERQYYTAMGFVVACDLSCSLPAAVYIAELRSGQTVHPTLRIVAQQMGNWLKDNVPDLAMHHDTSPDEWSIKRGTQDIVKKAA